MQNWHPDYHQKIKQNYRLRQAITRAIRTWFDGQDFLEVDTPILQHAAPPEVHLQPFVTEIISPDGQARTQYLHSSPEMAMKKLLVAGEERIYQICHVFRNREGSPQHRPEFSLLEWYRTGGDLPQMAGDATALIQTAARASQCQNFRFNDMNCDPFAPMLHLTVAEAFDQYAGIDVLATAPDPLHPDFELLARAAEAAGCPAHEGDDWESLFFRIMMARIEPFLGQDRICFLSHYPLPLAALAARDPADPRVALRAEIYASGMELANGFVELTDATEQRQRLLADQSRRAALYGTLTPIDEDFLAALDYGMKPAMGMALGFDRLVMLCCGAEDIGQISY
ncbi:MAG: EF-P lysine aminoacylase EpmA [Alphaproteobacteria bacterium]|nr:EF-P lysine aminoacylase EpmA [Alphaproteobacteria bacterium]